MYEVVRTRYTAYQETSYMDVVGVDISKVDFHAHLLQNGGATRRSFPNSGAGYMQMLKWLKNRHAANVHVCMEATGSYWMGLATALYNADQKVSVVNPNRTAMFARSQLRRTKTDRADAEMIAQFCKTQSPPPWTPPAREIRELRGVLTYREQLISHRTKLKQIANEVAITAELRTLHVKQIEMLDEQIDGLENALRTILRKLPSLAMHVEKLSAIDGIGFLTATAIVAKLPFDRLRNAKAAAAYVGLAPSERQSGTSIKGKPRICKIGSASLRRDLYLPALSAMRHNPILKKFAERLAERGKPSKVVIVAVMRKLIVLAYRLLAEPKFQLVSP